MKTALVTKYSSFKLFADLLDPRNRMKQVFEFNLKDIGHTARQMFFNMPTLLADRKWCEFDNDFIQFIPYISLVDRETKEVFLYERGNGSGEQRLVSLSSIGIGGHIEDLPFNDLFETIFEGSLREIKEEIGINYVDEDQYHDLKNALESAMVYLDRRTETESVHLGLFAVFMVDKETLDIIPEDGTITKSQWMPLQEVLTLRNLEPWSAKMRYLIGKTLKD